jgi:hypothetical protein
MTKRRGRGHAAAGSRILVGGLATSATLGIAGILAAPANQAAVIATIPRVRTRISLAPPKRIRPAIIVARAAVPARVARAAPVTVATPPATAPAMIAPLVIAPPVTALPVTAPPPPPAPPVSVSTAS